MPYDALLTTVVNYGSIGVFVLILLYATVCQYSPEARYRNLNF